MKESVNTYVLFLLFMVTIHVSSIFSFLIVSGKKELKKMKNKYFCTPIGKNKKNKYYLIKLTHTQLF